MIHVENKDLVIPGQVLADDEYYSGRGTFKENGKVCSSLMGLVSLRNKKISVIPLKSKYVPKKGDVVIGKIKDVRFSMWDVDINSPYSGILPAFEVFGREAPGKTCGFVHDHVIKELGEDKPIVTLGHGPDFGVFRATDAVNEQYGFNVNDITGFLNVNGEKMSKSLHNFITIRELLESYEPDTSF